MQRDLLAVDGAAGDSSGVKPADFKAVQTMAREIFGLDLKTGKEALVGARLGKRVRQLGLKDISEYLKLVEADRSGVELASLIDALTTNFTSFMREMQHFTLLKERILPELQRKPRFSIWSAGCSTGEEPYSILFQVSDTIGEAKLGAFQLMATDISTRVLAAASSGVYQDTRLKELPEPWQRRFFQRGTGQSQGLIRVKQEWRSRVKFDRLNLMEDFSRLPKFDVIFCRNVMIYFDKPTQEHLIQRFSAQLEPDGWLLIGHSEGMMGIRHDLKYVMPAVYRKGSGR